MSKEIKEAVFLCVELFLTAVLLVFILFLKNPADKVKNKQSIDTSINSTMNAYRDLYMYDDKYVTGDDVIALIQKYREGYYYVIDANAGQGTIGLVIDDTYVQSSYNLKDINGNAISQWDTDVLKSYFFINKKPFKTDATVYSTGLKDALESAKSDMSVIYKARLLRIPYKDIYSYVNAYWKASPGMTVLNNDVEIKYLPIVGKKSNSYTLDFSSYYGMSNKDTEYTVYGVYFDRQDSVYITEPIRNSLVNESK